MANELNISPDLKATVDLLINLCLLLAQKLLPKNSSNSSIPPSADPNRGKTFKAEGKRKPGGQSGHPGTTLKPVDNPDKIVPLTIDRSTPPPGKWKAAGREKRQVIELEIQRVVTEYQAEILENERGELVSAEFPEGAAQSAQYGQGVKSRAVYMPVHQMAPCERVSEHFANQINIPLSAGSLCNFKEEAYAKLEWFEGWVAGKLQNEAVLNCDETGINIGGKRVWLHNVSSEGYTLYFPPGKRGRAAKPKSRNLLERLTERADEVLRFMTVREVPFTNNQAERDLRMMKVQQKVSGCFRSREGAKIYCRIRNYISTCLKQGMTASKAVNLIFQDALTDFVTFSNIPAE